MIKRLFFLTLSLGILSVLSLHAQQAVRLCGTKDVEAVKQQMLQNRQEMRGFVFPRNAVTYVPVRFILVAKSDGSGRPNERLALRALCHLNEQYADQDIQFYLSELSYYNSTAVYANPTSFVGSNTIKNQMKYNAINVFITNEADDAAAYYQPPAGPGGNDWIVATSAYVDDVRVLAHEVGHFLSLPHPFHGWESSGGWDPNIHGNPVGTYAPDGQTLNELVNGNNCNNAGDDICDTPADYMFPSGNCTYNLNAKDPNGQLLSPDKENIMNYHFGCSSYHFTDGQKQEIQNSLFSSSRNYVRPNYTPNLTEVNQSPSIVAPAQNEEIATYNHVLLQWTEVPGADFYLVEISNASIGTRTYVVEDNSLLLTDLEPNKGYIWKVMGFNEYHTCANYSSQKIFKTGNQVFTATVEEVGFEDWTLFPNPVSSSGSFFLSTRTTQPVEMEVHVRTLTGQTLYHQSGIKVPAGTTDIEINAGTLPAGLYLVSIRAENAIDTKRLAVVE